MVEAYKRSSQFRDGLLLGQPVSFPGVVAWDVLDDERKLLTCHYSRQAVCVGTNQNWPCTDLFLWYGRIEPGEEKTCYGHLLFAEWDVAEFSRHAEDLALKWQAKENLELKSQSVFKPVAGSRLGKCDVDELEKVHSWTTYLRISTTCSADCDQAIAAASTSLSGWTRSAGCSVM